jgi:hypothetical protein
MSGWENSMESIFKQVISMALKAKGEMFFSILLVLFTIFLPFFQTEESGFGTRIISFF